MFVVKRNGEKVAFDKNKIINAILKANMTVGKKYKISEHNANQIAGHIEWLIQTDTIRSVEEIQEVVENALMSIGCYELAKRYIRYRYHHNITRLKNTTDDDILTLIGAKNKDVMEENANKNAYIVSTQRDLMAGEVSKDISKRLLLPKDIVEAHNEGVLHFHDLDYFIQPMHNCCLINIKDMLENGTVMNGKLIETPKSFQVACTVMTQIIACVASSQYGGQSVAIKHLGKYLKLSEDKFRKEIAETLGVDRENKYDPLDRLVAERLRSELRSGVQTIQYQINTLMTTNGQSPFVTIFMELDKNDPYLEYTAMIIEEILKQRYEGIKNEKGVYITPAFPKLIYVLDEINMHGGKYDYITKLAGKCSAKRMYPDYISAKKMRENYDGEVFSCMGCRSFLSPWKDKDGKYKWEGRFNMGVVSINLPQIGILSGGEQEVFWELLDERLTLCKKALMCRYERLKGTPSDVSPIHWQYGALARLKKGETIDPLLENGYSTISLGYIGLYEVTKLMTGKSHTSDIGKVFAKDVMESLRRHCEEWKRETGLGFGLYGTPAESLCYRFARIDKERFGDIKDVTDKGYYTNSYHVDVRETINAFDKLDFESQFQKISSGGAISYVEIPNLRHNLEAIYTLIDFIYDHIQYAEFNTKSDYCHVCGYDGEIIINDNNEWECPNCHNKDHKQMNVTRRVCGYLGENFFNVGKTKEIKSRKLHL